MPLSHIININIQSKHLIMLSIGLIFLFLSDTMIMYICFGDSGPRRANILLELSLTVYMIMFYRWLSDKIKTKEVIIKYLSILMIIVFSTLSIPKYFQLRQSYIYSQQTKIREQQVRTSTEDEIIILKPLPDSGLLLSYFCNEETWLQNVYLPYFNKNNCVMIDESY